jgi:hypothetical protein
VWCTISAKDGVEIFYKDSGASWRHCRNLSSGSLFARAAVQSRRYAAGQATEECELAAMMHGVQQQLAPEEVPNRPRAAVRVLDLSVQIGRLEPSQSVHCIVVYDSKRRGKLTDGSGTLDVRRLHVKPKLALGDAR